MNKVMTAFLCLCVVVPAVGMELQITQEKKKLELSYRK